jgi:hypothetical protein
LTARTDIEPWVTARVIEKSTWPPLPKLNSTSAPLPVRPNCERKLAAMVAGVSASVTVWSCVTPSAVRYQTSPWCGVPPNSTLTSVQSMSSTCAGRPPETGCPAGVPAMLALPLGSSPSTEIERLKLPAPPMLNSRFASGA